MKLPASHEVKQALVRAEDAFRSAEYDLKGGFVLASANRSYYTCFYCITALLYTKDVEAKTHQGAHSRFSEHFIKTGVLYTSSAAIVRTFFDKRQEADFTMSPALETL